jgi:hypothetical protein
MINGLGAFARLRLEHPAQAGFARIEKRWRARQPRGRNTQILRHHPLQLEQLLSHGGD